MVSLLAFYLPQFHAIPENDRWWGRGFTEWTSVRAATPLFPGHLQPRRPDQSRYYSLLDPSVREWQANLARQYGLNGFCYHHYWFNGRRLLERPFEEVLASERPDFPFCLSWANEPWTRSWTGRRREVLMDQSYGEKRDWEAHFRYLATAFVDPRYIRVDGRPVFTIYRPSQIPHCERMIARWRDLARSSGFRGLYLLHVLNTFERDVLPGFDGAIELEPMFTLSHRMSPFWTLGRYGRGVARTLTRRFSSLRSRFLDTIEYDVIWQRILDREAATSGAEVCPGAFPDWDNTPRRGRDGTIVLGASPAKFEINLARQIARADRTGAHFVFINAWNEWAEGAYLEPDIEHGFGYLEALQRSRSIANSSAKEIGG